MWYVGVVWSVVECEECTCGIKGALLWFSGYQVTLLELVSAF